jgi:hypothetical protein
MGCWTDIKLCCLGIYEYMFSDMLHQDYLLSYMQKKYTNRDEQWFGATALT